MTEEYPGQMLRLRRKPQSSPTTSISLCILNETSWFKFRTKTETLWRNHSLRDLGLLRWTLLGSCLAPEDMSQRALKEWHQKGRCYRCARRDSYHCLFQLNALQLPLPPSSRAPFCHLHPLVDVTLLSPPLLTHWREREGCWEEKSLEKCLLFKNTPFLFSCSICIGKNRQLALIADEAPLNRFAAAFLGTKAHPPLQTPLKGVGGMPHSGYALI